MAAVDRDLLERLNEVGRAIEVRDQLLGGFLAAGDEFVELRASHRTVPDFLGEAVASTREAGGDGETDTDRIIDFVRYACHQATQSGELLSLDQAALRLLQLPQRVFGVLLGSLELQFRLLAG